MKTVRSAGEQLVYIALMPHIPDNLVVRLSLIHILHVETVKGKGYGYAEQSPDTYHGVSGFDPLTGKTPPSGPSFSAVFGDTLCELAREDARICAITALSLIHI